MRYLLKYVLLLLLAVPMFAMRPATFYKGESPQAVESESAQIFESEPSQSFEDDFRERLADMEVGEADNTKWAIIISPEVYDETDDVAYSVNSGKLFEQVALKVLHVSQRRTYSLIGPDATTGKIKNRLNKLMKFVRAGDTIYFYYSGHGIPDIETKEPYILPKDLDPAYISNEDEFKLSSIYSRLQESKATKIVAFVDSCFSGATDNKTLFKGVAAPRIKAKIIEIDKTKMVVLTAGQDKQFSNMYEDKKMRLFSYFLMKNLVDGKKSIGEVYQSTKDSVEKTSFEIGDQYYQSPTISGNSKMTY